ncbi:MAG: cytochrome C oxidase subunit IV family protein [Anaerolineae bacterium]|nr:cytochrome C oxidase subunit IV family protein [Anaerolineae bacterium]
MEHHILPVKTYLIVFGLLMLLMAATIAAAFVDFGPLGLPIALAIAATKAVLVILYFMHIKFEGRLMAVFAAAGFFFLLVLVTFTLGDFIARDISLSPSTYAVPFDRLD